MLYVIILIKCCPYVRPMGNQEDWNDRSYSMASELIEEFFDRHEYPENLLKSTIWSGTDIISIYQVEGEHDRFLLEIKFHSKLQTESAYRLLKQLFGSCRQVSIFAKNKKLFLRKFRY